MGQEPIENVCREQHLVILTDGRDPVGGSVAQISGCDMSVDWNADFHNTVSLLLCMDSLYPKNTPVYPDNISDASH